MIPNNFLFFVLGCLALTAICKIDLFPGERWETGTFLASDPSKNIFYYLVKCRNNIKNPPLLIWLEGGPAYSSALGIYAHGGPYIVNNKTLEIERNPYAWNEIADVLFIDQPSGTLFSMAKDWKKICRDMNCVANDLLVFLKNFMNKYTDYKERDLYISGISYGGHYVPVITKKIMTDAPELHLKGMITFNAFFDYGIQTHLNFKLLYDRGLLDEKTWQLIDGWCGLCLLFQAFKIPVMYEVCGQSDSIIFGQVVPDYAPYDIENKYAPDPYEVKMLQYLNVPDVQEALGVHHRFSLYNWTIYYHFLRDTMDTTLDELEWVVKHGLKTYFVYGDADFMCSEPGGLALAESMDWEGKKEFAEKEFTDWIYNGVNKAYYKEVKNVKFIGVRHAGHSIFYSQRHLGLEIFKEFMQ